MTVHKSQGSEFNEVLLILPDKDVPVLTRELIYTAITRARKRIEIWGIEAVFQTAVSRRITRMSGLRDELWIGHNPLDSSFYAETLKRVYLPVTLSLSKRAAVTLRQAQGDIIIPHTCRQVRVSGPTLRFFDTVTLK